MSKLRWFYHALAGEPQGHNEYVDLNHWLSHCVLARLIMAMVVGTASLFLAQAFLADHGALRATMIVLLWMINAGWAVLLAFGAGRNYERLCFRRR